MTSPDSAAPDPDPDPAAAPAAAAPAFPHPVQRPSELATAETIRGLFLTFLRRPVTAAHLAHLLETEKTVREIEMLLRNAKEYRLTGEMRHTWFRTGYDCANLVLAPARVIFCPIAKVANTSVKHWFVKLSGQHVAQPSAVHAYIDDGKSGLQAQQFSFAALDPAFSGDDWARVAIVRDPVDRVISAYWDKFVRNRANAGVLGHTTPAYRMIYDEPATRPGMIARGITFRQFCHFLSRTARDHTDPHWAPQHRYLENYRWDRLFDMDRISGFEDFVRARLDPGMDPGLRDLPLGLTNAAQRDDGAGAAESLADRLPETLDTLRKPPNAAFLTEDIARFLGDYYAMDQMLIDRARRESGAAR